MKQVVLSGAKFAFLDMERAPRAAWAKGSFLLGQKSSVDQDSSCPGQRIRQRTGDFHTFGMG